MSGKPIFAGSSPNRITMLRTTLLLALTLLLFQCQRRTLPAGPPTTAPAPEAPFTFTVLQLNDVYEVAPLEGGRVGGLARVATLLRQLEAADSSTIAVLAGDFLSPSFVGNLRLDNGERVAGLQMVEALNALGLDYVTFGNHEFDLRSAELLGSRIDQSRFVYISSNALRAGGDMPRPFQQRGREIRPYEVHTFTEGGDTLRVALVGTVLPFNQADYVTYLPVTASFQQAVAAARREADVVLGLTHLAVDQDSALATTLTGVPLLMGGHDHENMRLTVNNVAITKADANAKTVYVHRFTYHPATQRLQLTSELLPITDALAAEPATADVVARWQARTDSIVQAQGYEPHREILRLTTPLEGTEAAIRNRPTNYGSLANEAFAAVWPGADVYLFNSGSLRIDDNLIGVVTVYDVLRTFPYGGPMVRMKLDGQTLLRVLNIGTNDNRGEGGYLQIRNATATPTGWQIDGEALRPGKIYTVVLPEFVAAGREANLGFLAGVQQEKPSAFTFQGKSINNDIRDLIIAYMETLGER